MADMGATGRFTTLSTDDLAEAMRLHQGVGALATVNEDGTPNIAVFVPLMPDDSHVVLTLAPNRSRANLERTGRAVLLYDVANPTASEKADRHKGARLQLDLVDKNDPEHAEVVEAWSHMGDGTMVLAIREIEPVG